ncbi:hypothetical protein RRG08_004826 [Elysia crispata]|uniref:N-acetylneuraminate lyase n=1 Tax=Elysia crispata TaxID=231223 RepID=A0AAE0Y540_9GAST|nr:hypothetical protein RRG08_004826 [Elysia crispata]
MSPRVEYHDDENHGMMSPGVGYHKDENHGMMSPGVGYHKDENHGMMSPGVGYHKDENHGMMNDLVDYCGRVALEAEGLPFYYYHIPDRTGVRLNMEEFLHKARDQIPNLRGIKFSSKDLYEGFKCLRTKDAKGHNFDILFGCDEQVIAAFAMGFRGAIGSTYSLLPGVYRQAKLAMDDGRLAEARELQARSVRLVHVCFKFGKGVGRPIPAFKAILNKLGVPVGPTRFPMATLDQQATAELIAELSEAGFFQWIQE